jgi:hypothetical protein
VLRAKGADLDSTQPRAPLGRDQRAQHKRGRRRPWLDPPVAVCPLHTFAEADQDRESARGSSVRPPRALPSTFIAGARTPQYVNADEELRVEPTGAFDRFTGTWRRPQINC